MSDQVTTNPTPMSGTGPELYEFWAAATLVIADRFYVEAAGGKRFLDKAFALYDPSIDHEWSFEEPFTPDDTYAHVKLFTPNGGMNEGENGCVYVSLMQDGTIRTTEDTRYGG